MPVEKTNNGFEEWLKGHGINIVFDDYDKTILLFEPYLDKLDILNAQPDELEDTKKVRIGFAYIFEKRSFIYNYYTIFDLFNALCGLGNALA